MAFTDENVVMPVAPYGNMGGFGGDSWAWIILLLLLCGGNGFGGFGGDSLYPWMNQADITTSGFQNAATNQAVASLQNSVTGGFGDVQNALCSGFAGVNSNLSNGFAQSEISANARQIADMQQSFANQTAMMQGFNGIQSQFADCCCENRLGLANLNSTILSENCADRAAISDGIRDILVNQTANTQKILDQMCSDKIDAKNEKIADLERQLTMADLRASQGAQTAAILANNEAQTANLERYLAPTPIPAYVVQNPNCCGTSYGCGCGA